ncbi:transposase, partial [Myxococcota bacterium]|nr:transposase [Myxococcota bacterium]
ATCVSAPVGSPCTPPPTSPPGTVRDCSTFVVYIARPPLFIESLRQIPNGDLTFKLKTPWDDGTTHLVFTPTELIEKLAAIIPPPRFHKLRYQGHWTGSRCALHSQWLQCRYSRQRPSPVSPPMPSIALR